MINFIYTNSPDRGIKDLARSLSDALLKRVKVVWLLSGGSNVSISVEAMAALRKEIPFNLFKNLYVGLVDERYGEVGHKDSNWQAFIDSGFDFDGVKKVPVLTGLSLRKTVIDYSKNISEQFEEASVIIGQFGIGSDGHIAGILPYSRAVFSEDLIFAYDALPLRRITITASFISKVNQAFVFVFGADKKEAVRNLRDKNLSLEEQPAQILKKISQVFLYSNQL